MPNFRDFDIVPFDNRSTPVKERMRGHLIGESVVVAFSTKAEEQRAGSRYRDNRPLKWRIFCLYSGKPLVKARFIDWEDAMKFAVWLEAVYRDKLLILSEYPDLDVFELSANTVIDGQILKEAIKILDREDLITWENWENALTAAKQYA